MTIRAPYFSPPQPPGRGQPESVQGVNLSLRGGGLQPFAQYDWPNPRAPTPQQVGFAYQALALYSVTPKPFAQLDWPNPRAPFPQQVGFAWQGNALIGGGLKPFAQLDWPNPRAPTPQLAGFAWQGNAIIGNGTTSTVVFRRTLSPVGTRVGSRQATRS